MAARPRPGPPQRPSPESTSAFPLDVQEHFFQLEAYLRENDKRTESLESAFTTPEEFGAVGDGETVDTTAMSNALTAAADLGRIVRLNATKKYRIGSITIPANVQIVGALPGRDITTDNVDADYTVLGAALLLDSGATITIGAGGALSKTVVRPYGQAYPQTSSSAWAGTAVTISGYGSEVANNWIIGFDTGVDCDGFSRVFIGNNSIDCNNPIKCEGSFDTTRIIDNQCWPFATHKSFIDSGVDYASRDKTMLYRTGVGIYLGLGNDHTTLRGNLCYGHLVGIDVAGGSISMDENWVDHPGGVARSGNIGVRFNEGATNIKAGNLWVWGCNEGALFDQLSNETVDVESLLFDNIDADAIVYDSGTVTIINLTANGIGGNVIDFNSNSVRCRIDSGRFTSVTGNLFDLSVNLTTENFSIGSFYTDQADGTAPVSTSVVVTDPVASASPLNLPVSGDFFQVTGTTGFSSIAGSYAGRRVTLWFASALTISTGGNIKLAGNYTTSTHDTLDLIWDGFEWLEISRSVNA